ncbi:hypothetical protein MTR_4g048330 [Medicago truncatula]|uniref:Uncharacterized protein n=1 Tax=Medicago truncatula TaxID=3880 RepID=A0A072UIU5_MEDTR|nr:hypothetical protein MTR_4g048330 [Medicago truncatula]
MPPRQAPIIVQQANTDSVFYVHPSEGPNSVAVTPLLTDSNYLAWSRSMKRALGAKNNFKNSSLRLIEFVLLLFVLQSTILNKMKSLWEELNSHRPMHVCTCPYPCRCESMRAAREFRMEDQVIQFLTGLHDNFSVVKTQVLLMDPLPSINKVYSMVVQEESNNTAPPPISIEDSSILVNALDARKLYGRGKSPSGYSQSKNTSRYCTFCHRNNHTVDFCYQKHGYPNANKSLAASNVVTTESSTDSQSIGEGSSSISQTGLTQEQYVHLVSLLQQSSLVSPASTSNPVSTNHIVSSTASHSVSGINTVISCSLNAQSNYWLIDLGANEHICCSLSLLHSFHKIKPMNVILPNGTSVIVHYAGTAIFSRTFHITNVLYSPHFKVNLISFFALIQVLSYEKMIGLGSLVDGLYRLDTASCSQKP